MPVPALFGQRSEQLSGCEQQDLSQAYIEFRVNSDNAGNTDNHRHCGRNGYAARAEKPRARYHQDKTGCDIAAVYRKNPVLYKGTEKGVFFTNERHTFFLHEQKSGLMQSKIKNPGDQPGITAVILFIFTTIAVKYACNRIATKPAESALRNPWAVFISPFFSSIL